MAGFAEFMTPFFAPFWLIFVLFFGACLGSFATALVYRLPRNIPMGKAGGAYSRSACPSCDHALSWRDLVPVWSWVWLRGRCRYCQAKISSLYPLTEILTLSLCAILYLIYGYTALTVILLLMAPVIISILMIDIRHLIIPDCLNAALALGAIAAVFTANMKYTAGRDYDLLTLAQQSVTGGVVYFLMALMLAVIFTKALKKDALGGGDIKFFGAAGLWLGVWNLPMFMMLSGGFGVIFALIWQKITGSTRFPFGPSLVAAFIFLLCVEKTVF